MLVCIVYFFYFLIGNNNTAVFGSSARMAMGSEFTFTNTPFLRNDELLYPPSAEMTHSSSILSDDSRGWPIMSTGDSKPNEVSEYNKYSGGHGCPSGSLDRCLQLCASNPSLPQNDYSTQAVFISPNIFQDCVLTCRTFCTW
jgi:hypothetical protein